MGICVENTATLLSPRSSIPPLPRSVLCCAELLQRAVLVARSRDSHNSVDVADLERVLIQAMLDFKQ